jgi:hypothetical protein
MFSPPAQAEYGARRQNSRGSGPAETDRDCRSEGSDFPAISHRDVKLGFLSVLQTPA